MGASPSGKKGSLTSVNASCHICARWIQAEPTASEARASLGRWMVSGPYSGGIAVGEEAVCVPHGWPFALGLPSGGQDWHARSR